MPSNAIVAKALRLSTRRDIRPDLAERKKKERDASLFEEDRQAAVALVDARIDAKRLAFEAKLRGLIDEAWKTVLAKRPAVVAEEAAFANPQHTAATAQLAKNLPVPMLKRLAERAVEDQDAAAAYAIRQAMSDLIEKGEDCRELGNLLEKVGEKEYMQATADLVGTQHQLAKFLVAGPYDDVTKVEPIDMLKAANKVGLIPLNEQGKTVSLPTDAVKVMCERAGVPLGPD